LPLSRKEEHKMPNYKSLPRGKRIVEVIDKDTGETLMPFATYADLKETFGFTQKDLKNVHNVLVGDRPTLCGVKLRHVGVLRDS
jgi:hypothetical protein